MTIKKSFLKVILPLMVLGTTLAPNMAMANETYKVPKECNYLIEIVEQYNWDTVTVIKLAYAESKCDKNAINWKDSHRGCRGSYSYLQIGCLHFKAGENKLDTKVIVEKAYRLYVNANGSFKDWSTCRKIKNCS